MPDREFSQAELAAMDEIAALGMHPNNYADTLADPDAPPELVAKLEEIAKRYSLREIRPGVWGIEG